MFFVFFDSLWEFVSCCYVSLYSNWGFVKHSIAVDTVLVGTTDVVLVVVAVVGTMVVVVVVGTMVVVVVVVFVGTMVVVVVAVVGTMVVVAVAVVGTMVADTIALDMMAVAIDHQAKSPKKVHYQQL